MQYIGQDNDDTLLSGMLYPEITKGIVSLGELRDMAATGKTYTLMNDCAISLTSVRLNHTYCQMVLLAKLALA